MCTYKNREFSYNLKENSDKDSIELFNDLYDLFVNKVGILSNEDKQKKKYEFQNLQNQLKTDRNKWTNIKKKNIKDYLIEQYIIKLKHEHSLGFRQTKYLFGVVLLLLLFKIIIQKDIVYENNKIININGLTITKNGNLDNKNDLNILFKSKTINECLKYMPFSEEIVEVKPIVNFNDNWRKFLTKLDKYKIRD